MQAVDDLIVLDFLEWLNYQLMVDCDDRPDILDIMYSDGNYRYILEDYAQEFLENSFFSIDIRDCFFRFLLSKEFKSAQLQCKTERRYGECRGRHSSLRKESLHYVARKCSICPFIRRAFYQFCESNADLLYRSKYDVHEDVTPERLADAARYYWNNRKSEIARHRKFREPILAQMQHSAEIELSEEMNFFVWMEKNTKVPTELRKMPFSVFEEYVDRYVEQNQRDQNAKSKLLKSFERTGWTRILEKLQVLFRAKKRESKDLQTIMERYYSKSVQYKCIILPLGDPDSQREYRSLISDHWDTLNDCSRDYLDIYYSEKDTGKTGFDIASRINSLPAHILNQPPCLVLWENSIKDAELVRIRNLHGDQIVELIRSIVDGIIADKNLQDIVSDARNKVEELKMENKGVERFFNISGNHNIVGDGNAVGNGIVNGNQNTVTGNVIQMGVSEEVSSLVKEFDSFIDSLNGIAGIDENIKKQVIEIMNQAKEGVAEQSEEKKSAAKKAFDLVKPFLNYVPKVLALLANSAQIAAFFGLGA